MFVLFCFFFFLEITTRSLRNSGVDEIKQLCAQKTVDTLNHLLFLTLVTWARFLKIL